jgi:hypothetical protein
LLISGPFYLLGVLIQDPRTFALWNPFLVVVLVRCGLRYGMRTMYLACGSALVASTLLATSPTGEPTSS